MSLQKSLQRRIRGSVLMEFVLVMPILITLIMLVLQFAQAWTARQIVSYAAFCAARATLCVTPAEQPSAARKAARQSLAWINIFGGGRNSMVSVPGWGQIPESDSIDKQGRLDVSLNQLSDSWYIQNLAGKKPVVASVTVSYKFPLVIPIAGRLMSSDFLTGEPYPYIQFRETGVVPLPYSTANFPYNAYSSQ